ncbi:hypothetical protein LSM04_004806 [Trypanosoma melophagium]|uniref:uncharacterized protein n=1 Tax=Trypanosoma melophagium TaxID=715481 RepID=UPI00351A705E|nr:hypothetical protein LSM04_004806 [Trypanosoma melophagium]
MEISPQLLVEGAPMRQRCLRVKHILFGDLGCVKELSAQTRNEIFFLGVNYLKVGLSVSEMQDFIRLCDEKHFVLPEGCVLSVEDEATISSRANAAMQSVLSASEHHQSGDSFGGTPHNLSLGPKRSRLEAVGMRELRGKMRMAEILADMHDYDAMNKTLKGLFLDVHSMQEMTTGSQGIDSALVELEIIRRSVELSLSAGALEIVKTLMGSSMTSLIEHAAQYMLAAQGGGLSHIALQQHRCTEGTVREIEEHVLFFSIVRALCMFEDCNFDGFVAVFTANGLRGAKWAPLSEELLTKHGTAEVAASLGARINTSGTLPAIRHLRYFVEKFITSGAHLGVMLLFSAFAALPRMEAMELIVQVDIRQLWEDVPDACTLVQTLEEARFAEALNLASKLASSFLKTDIFACKHSELLLRQFQQAVVTGYVSNFTTLDVRKAASRLSINVKDLQQLLQLLILEGRLSAKLDLVALVLTRGENYGGFVDTSCQCSTLLECIAHSDNCTYVVEQSLRNLSLHRNHM